MNTNMSVAEADYVDYIVRYGRPYENGQVFDYYTFKSSNGRIVPILFAPSAPKISSKQENNQLLGYALLEDRDDGMIAKCEFKKDTYGKYVKRILQTRDHYCLTFQTTPWASLDKTIEHGAVTAVLVIPTWFAYKLDDSENEEEE